MSPYVSLDMQDECANLYQFFKMYMGSEILEPQDALATIPSCSLVHEQYSPIYPVTAGFIIIHTAHFVGNLHTVMGLYSYE